MSQEGAVAMASPPYSKQYGDILRHYYVGTELTPLAKVSLPPPAIAARP
jgi:peptidoglycan hydrolase-like amidase